MKFIMHLTIQNIKRRRVRTILTLLGVMIGVVAVVSLLSLGMGVKRELLQGYGDDASIRQITVQTPENNQNKKMLLTDHTIEKLAKLDKVANVYPRYEVFTNSADRHSQPCRALQASLWYGRSEAFSCSGCSPVSAR